MINFEDIFNAYQFKSLVPKEYSTSMFQEELKQQYINNKNEIFDYYEPRVLAEKLAGIDIDKLEINNNNLYNWGLTIVKPQMRLMFSVSERPDIFSVNYRSIMDCFLDFNYVKYMDSPNGLSNMNNELSKSIECGTNEFLKKLQMPIEISKCEGNLTPNMSNVRYNLETYISFVVKKIPKLDDIKIIEYTVPRFAFEYNSQLIDNMRHY